MADNNGRQIQTSEDIETATNINEQERQKRHATLTTAKDKAQMAASTAMSVVNVAMLKAVLDRGPEGSQYHWLSLGIISAALALQIVAGLLAIWVSQLVGYMDRYGENACDGDLLGIICPCHCVRNKDASTTARVYHRGRTAQRGEDIPLAGTSTDPENASEARADGIDDDDEVYMYEDAEDEGSCCSCCGSTCVTGYPEHEHKILRRYHEWRRYILDREFIDQVIRDEIQYLTGEVDKAKASVAEYEKSLKTETDEKERGRIGEELESTQVALKEAQKRKLVVEARIQKLKDTNDQGAKLAAYAKSVQKVRVMKMATFYQNLINYIFYVVFVLNTFIAGFGIGADASASGGGHDERTTRSTLNQSYV